MFLRNLEKPKPCNIIGVHDYSLMAEQSGYSKMTKILANLLFITSVLTANAGSGPVIFGLAYPKPKFASWTPDRAEINIPH